MATNTGTETVDELINETLQRPNRKARSWDHLRMEVPPVEVGTPGAQGSGVGGGRDRSSLRDQSGVPADAAPRGYLTRMFPGVSATMQGSGEDMNAAFKEGRYSDVAAHGLRQLATLPVALADDAVGGAYRGLRNPVEDFGRTLFGASPRQPTQPQPATPAPVPRLRDLAAANPTAQPTATGPYQPGREPAPSLRDNVISYDPLTKTYSGRNVGANPTFEGGRGAGGYVSFNGGGGGAVSAAPQQAEVPQFQPTVVHSGNDYESRLSLRNLGASASSIQGTKKERLARQQLYQDAVMQDRTLRSGADPSTLASMKANADMHSANMSLRGQMYGADQRFRSDTYQAQAQAQTAGLRAQYDVAKDQRDFQYKVNQDSIANKQSADKAWNDHVITMFRTNVDGKDAPDTRRIADFNAAVSHTVGQMIPQLEASTDPAQRAYAERLKKDNLAALDEQDRSNLLKAFQRYELHRDGQGIGPQNASGSVTNDLRHYMRMAPDKSTLLQRRQLFLDPVTGMPSGRSIPDVDLEYGRSANRIWPNFAPTNDSLR